MGFLAQALACDLTRFGSVELHDLSLGAALGAGIAGVPDDNHTWLAHKYFPLFTTGNSWSIPAIRRAGNDSRWCSATTTPPSPRS